MKTRELIVSLCIALLLSGAGLKTSASPFISAGELVYVHTDRDIYIAGEYVFFKLYVIEKSTHKLSETSSVAYMVLRSRSNIQVAGIRFIVDHGTASGSIFLPDTLNSGPYQLTAFTNWMRNSGEESFFNEEIFVANRFDKDLSALGMYSDSTGSRYDSAIRNTPGIIPPIIATDKTEYHRRGKISLELMVPENVSGVMADLSVSVYEDALGSDYFLSASDYLSVTSEDTISVKSPVTYRFLPETKGEIIQGRVIDEENLEAVSGACVYLSVKDTIVNLKYDHSAADGSFRFLLNDYYDGKELVLSVRDNPENRKLKIEPEDKFKLNNSFRPVKFHGNQSLKDYVLKSQDIVSVQKIYHVVSLKKAERKYSSNFICPQLYYKPSYCVYPSDFVPLDDFIEISGEILPPQLRIKNLNGKYIVRMADENLQMFMDREPAVFLDGVIIHDINQIISLGSDKIERVEMICAQYICGELLFPGILAVFSTDDEIKNLQPYPVSLRMQPEIYHATSVFTAPAYEEESADYQPDFRQLLYWNPDIRISSGQTYITEFYASDHSANYVIRVEGVSSEGVAVSATAKIMVK